MRKLLIASAVAAIAAVPGVTGLVGNASFAQTVPVQVPAGAHTIDDHGRQAEPSDDHGRHAEPGDDRGQSPQPGDDHGRVDRHGGDGQASGSVKAGDGGSRRGGHDGGSADH
jgi:hypothetical protein